MSTRGTPFGLVATEEAWHRRTRAEPVPQREYLIFSVGGEDYGIDILRIREIIKVRPATEVPRVPSFIIGVVSVRGIVLPVIDLRLRLHHEPAPVGAAARYLIVARDDERFGLLVDRVRQVVRVGENEIEAPPPVLAGTETDFVAGIGRSEQRLVLLLDLDHILRFEVPRARPRSAP
ncbi:MAG: purine-binding chemotaxis protein CheW [Myxococcales bacterium]|nr:purine-binding chemotaxis protein CheW [Myxococcales bacterium]